MCAAPLPRGAALTNSSMASRLPLHCCSPPPLASPPTRHQITLQTTPSIRLPTSNVSVGCGSRRLRAFCPLSGRTRRVAIAVATGNAVEVLPPSLISTADPPPLFDGTTRLYISYTCPYAQRTWIARNYKGLQEKIKLVPIDLQDRPSWYKEKVYLPNKVPSLEHNNEVKGESLDLLKYIDAHFGGPELLPHDFARREFADELLSFTDTFIQVTYKAFTSTGEVEKEVGPTYDKIEDALSKFDEGPFFLGHFSLVDIAYAPFVERFQPFFSEVKNYEITEGRPKLALWIEELNNIQAYKQTQRDPQELLAGLKRKFGIN